MRHILLTGATGKIGLQLLKNMIDDGFHVTVPVRNRATATTIFQENEIPQAGYAIIDADLTSTDAAKKIVDQLNMPINAVIYNARAVENLIMSSDGKLTGDQFQAEMYMAVTFPYLLTGALIESGKCDLKDILFISSIYGVVAPTLNLYDDFLTESPINYGVAKAAQIHLTKELAVRLAGKNIRVNCISYGGVEGRADAEFMKRYQKLAPLGKMLSEKDLYPPLKYILQNKDLPVTGENIKVDGGWTLW